jgi:hypothetical protein
LPCLAFALPWPPTVRCKKKQPSTHATARRSIATSSPVSARSFFFYFIFVTSRRSKAKLCTAQPAVKQLQLPITARPNYLDLPPPPLTSYPTTNHQSPNPLPGHAATLHLVVNHVVSPPQRVQ